MVIQNLRAQNPLDDHKKGALLYQNSLASGDEVVDWKMEGHGVTEFKDGWMEMYSPDEEFEERRMRKKRQGAGM